MKSLPIPALRRVSDGIWTSGQPDAGQLRSARDAGFATIVSLCPHGECGWDERTTAESIGLRFASIPVGSACDLTESAARSLHDLLESCDKPVLVHCGSGNRVGALFALESFFVRRRSTEESVADGRAAGLAGLETAVRGIFNSAGDSP